MQSGDMLGQKQIQADADMMLVVKRVGERLLLSVHHRTELLSFLVMQSASSLSNRCAEDHKSIKDLILCEMVYVRS